MEPTPRPRPWRTVQTHPKDDYGRIVVDANDVVVVPYTRKADAELIVERVNSLVARAT